MKDLNVTMQNTMKPEYIEQNEKYYKNQVSIER